MVPKPKPDGDSLLYAYLNEDLVALPNPRGALHATHNNLDFIFFTNKKKKIQFSSSYIHKCA